MYYLIGDIHGRLNNLLSLYENIRSFITDDDALIFLGDYIDRGPSSYEVIEFLISLSSIHRTIFLKGNHEDMLLRYKDGENPDNFFSNGGSATLKSYKDNTGSFRISADHMRFYGKLYSFFETQDFIAVHAGLNPDVKDIDEQDEFDLLWIREKFFRSERKWDKTIIFGHTLCSILHGSLMEIYNNKKNNIIGIDTGACYGGILTCLRWPDKAVFQG